MNHDAAGPMRSRRSAARDTANTGEVDNERSYEHEKVDGTVDGGAYHADVGRGAG